MFDCAVMSYQCCVQSAERSVSQWRSASCARALRGWSVPGSRLLWAGRPLADTGRSCRRRCQGAPRVPAGGVRYPTRKTPAHPSPSLITKSLLISSINQWCQFICVLSFKWLTLELRSTSFSSTCSRVGSISISQEPWAYITRHKHDKSQNKVSKIVSFSSVFNCLVYKFDFGLVFFFFNVQ